MEIWQIISAVLLVASAIGGIVGWNYSGFKAKVHNTLEDLSHFFSVLDQALEDNEITGEEWNEIKDAFSAIYDFDDLDELRRNIKDTQHVIYKIQEKKYKQRNRKK